MIKLKCPKCGHEDRFRADVVYTGTIDCTERAKYGVQVEDPTGPQILPDGYIVCQGCDEEGRVKEFFVAEDGKREMFDDDGFLEEWEGPGGDN